jgi:hypothetical protein
LLVSAIKRQADQTSIKIEASFVNLSKLIAVLELIEDL